MHALHKTALVKSCNLKTDEEAKVYINDEIHCKLCSMRSRFWKNLVFRLFIKKGPWREGKRAGLDREGKLDSGLSTSGYTTGGCRAKMALRIVHADLHFILPPWPAIGCGPPSRSWLGQSGSLQLWQLLKEWAEAFWAQHSLQQTEPALPWWGILGSAYLCVLLGPPHSDPILHIQSQEAVLQDWVELVFLNETDKER